MKNKVLKTAFLALVFTFALVASSYAGSAQIITPSKIVAAHSFLIDFRSSGYGDYNVYEGRTDYVPYDWTMETSNQYLGGSFINFDTYEVVGPHVNEARVMMPGKWTIRSTYHPLSYVYNGGFDYWTTNYNVPTYINKQITVLGTVKFNPNHGKLATSKRTRLRAQKSRIGTLPTPARSGYRFTGWYTKAKSGTKISSRTIVRFSGPSKTYYAHWRRR